ncbi:hypothetical protein GCM10009839_58590 [Catenulispora yoronensis]|uniref:Uncharacterized protein n=1 Tax=Catenulispora yoronensis TaxID=450799 RepID=A0ABP5GP21_9ACTN
MRTLFAPGPGRHARQRGRVVADATGSSRPAARPAARPTEEIGLGARAGDADWLGRRRMFTADADMGVWVRASDFKEIV